MMRLSDYLDADLDAATAVEVERHLTTCGACLACADSLRRIIELCHAHGPGVIPRPLDLAARAELKSACQKALAARRRGSKRGNS